jgi:hypothetical protein
LLPATSSVEEVREARDYHPRRAETTLHASFDEHIFHQVMQLAIRCVDPFHCDYLPPFAFDSQCEAGLDRSAIQKN